jgi:hypothetical protein
MDVALVSGNLMNAGRITGVARQLGLKPQVVQSLEKFDEQLLSTVKLVMLDLDHAISPRQLAEHLREQQAEVDLLAFGPHVDVERLEAAREAGWTVYSHGQLHSELPRLLQRYVR